MTNTPIALVADDGWLKPYESDIIDRLNRFKNRLNDIGDIQKFASAHHYLGLNYDAKKNGWQYREWAPNAHSVSIFGDFNNWDRSAHPLQKNEEGVWEIFIPNDEGFKHKGLFKIHIIGNNGGIDRLPAYIKHTVQNEETKNFDAQLWAPKTSFKWTDKNFDVQSRKEPIIYECHVGMAQEKEGVGTYREFADNVLPRVKANGYNCLQMMAIQEHPYYGSFGYHVANFFAPSSRFGTPEDLKYLINKAHDMGIAVIMDIVHSHAVKNVAEGLINFDGSGEQYFHEGDKGYHTGWDSKLFDYGKPEVQQFLLSNLNYWLVDFHFDGFRFDGVTSMLYFHHGDIAFDHYDKYFKDGVDWDAVTYLQLANHLIHTVKKGAISIAEDMSGMPGACREIEDGGIGFDYRLGMGIPDYWINLLKHKSDEEWDVNEMFSTMTNRRYKEKTIAYVESHDQALVGDKTTAFWLMDKEMYFHMKVEDDNLIIDRGIALHKLLRLFTISLGGEGYLNFIGNEFGHGEWIDFPREGNDWSYKYARRQWSLVDNVDLKYKFLNEFDKSMNKVISENHILSTPQANKLNMDNTNNVAIFERGNLIFLFNFHPNNSIVDYRFYVPQAGKYKIILNSDNSAFGGHNRIDDKIDYQTFEEDGVNKLSLYLTNRTALIMKRVSD